MATALWSVDCGSDHRPPGAKLKGPSARPRSTSRCERAATTEPNTRMRLDRRHFAALVATALFAAALLSHFYDRYWWPPDEGAYGYVADRILAGDVLNRDVQDIHLGAVDFANAAALRLFGNQLVSMRYPLVLMTFVQSLLLCFLLLPRGAMVAAGGGMAAAALSLVQFLNPTAHWYCLFLTTVTIAWLTLMPRGRRCRLEVTGWLLATVFVFRQLSGVLTAIGVLTYLLLEGWELPSRGRKRLAPALAAVMFAGLGFYLLKKTDPIAIALYGVWPLALLCLAFARTNLADRELMGMLGRLGVGAAAGIAPLLAYHLAHGSVGNWLADTVGTAVAMTDLDFFRTKSYTYWILMGFARSLGASSGPELANGMLWGILPLVPVALGAVVRRRAWRAVGAGATDSARAALSPLAVVAVFYTVVSLHYQIPIYLFYSLSLSVCALLWLASATESGATVTRRALVPALAALSAIALYYQAGQPNSMRTSLFSGKRIAMVEAPSMNRLGLHIAPAERALYRRVVELVDAHAAADDTILAVPFDPEIYYLTGRRAPVRFFNSAFGIRDSGDLARALDAVAAAPPRVVFYDPTDKYDTELSRRLMSDLRPSLRHVGDLGRLQVYLLDDVTALRAMRASASELTASNPS
jgi:hypothetical protein